MVNGHTGAARPPGVTAELNDWSRGDFTALDRAFPLLYAELQKLAQSKLRNFSGYQTLDASSVLHEVYFRLGNTGKGGFASREQFFALASRIMRGILVDRVRKKDALNRRDRASNVQLSAIGYQGSPVDVLAVHEALNRLALVDAGCAEVVEMKFFGGLTHSEIALSTGVAEITVKRRWIKAQAWLREHLERKTPVTLSAEPAVLPQ